MGCSLRLQRFCCCCTLRTGTLVIGTLGWVGTLSQIFGTTGSFELENDDYEHSRSNATYALAARIGACLISLLISVLLIVGVYKQNNKFMLPWLVLQCLGCIAITIGFFVAFVGIFLVASNHTGLVVALTIVLFLFGLLGWYCWICVWSHYMELNERETTVSPNIQYSPSHVNPPPYTKAGAPLV